MAITLVNGTKEYISVTVVDTTGVLTTLDTHSPHYTVKPTDATTGDEKNEYYTYIADSSALNSGMMIQCLIDTNVRATYNNIEATNAPTLPVTITLGSNDQFKVDTVTYTIPAGVYTTMATLAAAVELSSDGAFGTLLSHGLKVRVTDNAKLALVEDTSGGVVGAWTGLQVLNGVTHNALPTIGFTNAQTFPAVGLTGAGEWDTGKYNLYVSFSNTGELPLLGPVAFYIV